MTVYVDNMRLQASVGKVSGRWSHLYAGPGTDIEELHQLAESIGLRRSWFQDHPHHPHYDVTDGKRWQAIRAGATEIDAYDGARLMLEARRAPESRTWPATETGPCGSCRTPTRRYGPEGHTLCPGCRPEAEPENSSPEAPSGSKAAVIAPRPAPEFDQPELFA